VKKISVYVIFVAALLMFFASAVTAQDISDIERDAKALELFLQDQEDYKKYCPHIPWDQPEIDVYKEKLKSQLPDNCKNETN
tara:strand:+ start:1318 stop:1563 length:246 start_codon:yes stop_codon:yes gene_type:complete